MEIVLAEYILDKNSQPKKEHCQSVLHGLPNQSRIVDTPDRDQYIKSRALRCLLPLLKWTAPRV